MGLVLSHLLLILVNTALYGLPEKREGIHLFSYPVVFFKLYRQLKLFIKAVTCISTVSANRELLPLD